VTRTMTQGYTNRMSKLAQSMRLEFPKYSEVELVSEAANCLEVTLEYINGAVFESNEDDFSSFIQQLTINHKSWISSNGP